MDILTIAVGTILFLLAILIGYLAGLYSKTAPQGIIHVRQSEEKDSYLFEFRVLPETIPSMKTITFKIVTEEDHSQNLQ